MQVAAEGQLVGGRQQSSLFAISQLAEGSDRLMSVAALGCGYTLQALLPFPEERYLEDFVSEASVTEFQDLLKRASSRLVLSKARLSEEEGYHAAGAVLLDHIDVLLAVWDGGGSKGPGGTTWMIDQMLRRGLPVIVIPTAAPSEFHLADRGVTIRLRSAEESAHQLRACLSAALNPQWTHRYWRERWPRWTSSASYAFLRLVGDRVWKRLHVKGSDAPCTDVKLSHLKEHYKWLDTLAQHFGEMSRSANLLLQVLAAFAVIMALGFSSLDPFKRHVLLAPKVFAVFEILAISGMLAIDWVARSHEWHELWLVYRALAEQVRCLDFLLPLGLRLPQTSTYETVAAFGGRHNRHAQFSVSLQAALARASGLPIIDSSEASVVSQQNRLFELVRAQRAYHAGVSSRHNRAATWLQHFNKAAFWGAASFCALDVLQAFRPYALEGTGGAEKLILKMSAGLLAAMGALAAGISSRGELRRLSQRSFSMKLQLERLEQEMKSVLQDAENHNAPPAIQNVADWAKKLAGILMSDVRDWQILLSGRPPEKE